MNELNIKAVEQIKLDLAQDGKFTKHPRLASREELIATVELYREMMLHALSDLEQGCYENAKAELKAAIRIPVAVKEAL